MKLRYTKKIIDGKIIIVFNVGVSSQEFKAIKTIGEPVIHFKRHYPISDTNVQLDIPLLSFKNVEVVFMANIDNIYNVANEAIQFISNIQDEIAEVTGDMVGEYRRILGLEDQFGKEEIEFPIKPYPDKPQDEPENTESDDDCNCDCGLKIGDEIPSNLKNDTIFGLITNDEEDD